MVVKKVKNYLGERRVGDVENQNGQREYAHWGGASPGRNRAAVYFTA